MQAPNQKKNITTGFLVKIYTKCIYHMCNVEEECSNSRCNNLGTFEKEFEFDLNQIQSKQKKSKEKREAPLGWIRAKLAQCCFQPTCFDGLCH